MNLFDKCCAVLAFLLGIVFLVLGAAGLFFGASANFTLPPIVGVIPALIGWGIIRAIVIAWKVQPPHRDEPDLVAPEEASRL